MKVIARTSRGMEAGEVLCEATDQALAQMPGGPGGQILREMSAADAGELSAPSRQGNERVRGLPQSTSRH